MSASRILLFVLILLLISLIPIMPYDFSIFTIKPFSFLASFHAKENNLSSSQRVQELQPHLWSYALWKVLFNAFIGFKGNFIHKPSSSISRALSPDITKCGPVTLPLDAITGSHCCPPIPSPFKFIDFKDFASNSNNTPRVRKPAHLVDDEYIAKLEKGIAIMKSLPLDDPRNFIQQAKIHCAYCNGAYPQLPPFENLKINIHRSWLFFPFHRWYIYFFERILGNLIGDPNFALPYWNWDSFEGMQMPLYFANPNSSLFHKLRNFNHTPPHLVDLNYDCKEHPSISQDQQVSYNLAFMYKQMVLANTKELFMGSPYRVGDEPLPGAGSLELAPHNTLHKWVGSSEYANNEDMGVFYTAARDPIFYPHHTNSDRLWEVWKTLEGEEDSRRRGYSDDEDWLDAEFFFYDENLNLVRVKARDCVDTKKLGYVYQDVDLPWLHASPKPQRIRMQREEAKNNKGELVLSSKKFKTNFPLVVDSIVSVVVERPKKLRCKREKEVEEEVLVIEGIEFESDKNIKFDVHVNDDGDNLSGMDKTELVGTFMGIGHGHGHVSKTSFKVGISKVLEDLEAEEDEHVVVTLVPKVGEGDVSIRSIKIDSKK